MTKVTQAQKAFLESVYQLYEWPIKKYIKEALAQQLHQSIGYVDQWFYRRHRMDRANLPAPQQQQMPPPLLVQPQQGQEEAQEEDEPMNQPQEQDQDEPMMHQSQQGLEDEPMFPYNDNMMLDIDLFLGIPEAPKIASDAIAELLTLCQGNEDLWAKDQITGKDVLVQHQYNVLYPKSVYHNGSRGFCDCKMDDKDLAYMLSQENWCEVFPNMVAKEKMIQILSPLDSEDPDGSLFLIYKEYQLTPTKLSANRKLIVFRTCKKIDQGWIVAEVTHEHNQNESAYQPNCQRLPSGCLIEPITNGFSRVTWVEHIEGGVAFGVTEMLSCLERTCERKSIEEATRAIENPSFQDKEKSILMRLGHTMVKGLFDQIGPNEDENSIFPSFDDFTTFYKVNDEVVGGAVMSFIVTQSPDFVLEILGNVKIRHEWDHLMGFRKLHPIVCYPTAEDTRNTVSLSKMDDEDIMLIQEVTVERARSLVVWSTLPRDASYRISLGEETDIPLLVSGFVICQNGDTTANSMGGSVVTLVLRKFSNVDEPLEFLDSPPLTALNETVKRVKEELDKRQPLSPPTGAFTQDEPVI
ncbi:Homeobox domain-containing protein/START domain-containing protein [Artemisia annua]|uniref:Homeobox domain-containing protein/START domain-containing protein n=1 Tax=Artemisia annua TaxID=35608 RepID=A0A2U1QKK3_ARTAN|nr:Homeobox domain-containing protein/START domain-containing protein [Artemisia annua]